MSESQQSELAELLRRIDNNFERTLTLRKELERLISLAAKKEQALEMKERSSEGFERTLELRKELEKLEKLAAGKERSTITGENTNTTNSAS